MSRYENIPTIKAKDSGIFHHMNVTYPEIPFDEEDLYIMTTSWERLDNLADRFYGSVYDYWIISLANPQTIDFGSMYVPSGIQLRIPTNINEIKSEYSRLND